MRLVEADAHPVYTAAGRLLGGFIAFDADKIDAQGAPLHQIAIKDHDEPALAH